jgi:signal peptide peptidase SppA
MISRQQLISGLFNKALMLHPLSAEILASNFRASVYDSAGEPIKRKAYRIIEGVALIPVQGVLVQKLGRDYSWGWITGYDGILANFADAVNDDAVKAIMLDIDSPGGDCAGCFDLVDMIFGARGIKPIWAVLNEVAYSAAYAIASACDRVTVPRTGGTGSIGVIAMLIDFSKMLDTDGVGVNILQFGARKADGSPYIPLSDAARERFQADVDATGELFVETVARNRKLAASKVLAQEATTFQGQNGVQAGLADMVAAPLTAFNALLATINP